MQFEIATWYDNWNSMGLANLVARKVPLNYATRYNLAFASLFPSPDGYTLDLDQKFGNQVLAQIRQQAPTARIYAGVGDTGLAETVADNLQNKNRATANIVAYLKKQGLDGIAIDAEGAGMPSVTALLMQLSQSFKDAGLGIAVSVPWPMRGPVDLYGADAVAIFNKCVDAVELQDYSSAGTPADVQCWLEAGVQGAILMGGVCTENSNVQTSLDDTVAWTTFALQQQLRGMFSWRLDNDHGRHGEQEDVDPTFAGAAAIYDTVHNFGKSAKLATGT